MSKMKIYSWGAGIVAAIFTTMVAWATLDLPRWAFISEVRASSDKLEEQIAKIARSVDRMAKFESGTRSILLDQEWWRKQSQIEMYEARPQTDTIRALVLNLKENQANIKKQITALKAGASIAPPPRSRHP